MWRYSASTGRFIFVDINASYALLPVLFHISLTTLFIAFLTMILFAIMEHYSLPPLIFMRYLRAYIGQGLSRLVGVQGRTGGKIAYRIRRSQIV